jgi:hypothetical protein
MIKKCLKLFGRQILISELLLLLCQHLFAFISSLKKYIIKMHKFFLNFSYYTMDCIGIQKHCKDGQFWANAVHFLFCSEIQGHAFFYHNINKDLNEKRYPIDKLVTAFSKNVKNSLLKVRALYLGLRRSM